MGISAAAIDILNNKMGGWAKRVGLGTIIKAAEDAVVLGATAGSITATELASNAVTTAKILNSNVTAAKLATDSVETAKIVNLGVTTAKIDDLAVTAGKIAADAVTTVKILDGNVTEAKIAAVSASTLGVKRILLGVLDATAGKDIGTHTIAAQIPSKSVLQRVDYEVITTCTSATDAATIALQIQSADDVVAAVAISNGGNPWDAGVPKVTKVTGATTTWIKCTAARTLSVVVAEEALTAGVIRVYGEFIQSV